MILHDLPETSWQHQRRLVYRYQSHQKLFLQPLFPFSYLPLRLHITKKAVPGVFVILKPLLVGVRLDDARVNAAHVTRNVLVDVIFQTRPEDVRVGEIWCENEVGFSIHDLDIAKQVKDFPHCPPPFFR